jgi:hypothetical protein
MIRRWNEQISGLQQKESQTEKNKNKGNKQMSAFPKKKKLNSCQKREKPVKAKY